MRISVNRDSHVPLQDQLVAQYSLLIAGGTFEHGELLPSIRSLAERLGVHRNTVAAAYRALEDAGFVRIKAGSGIRVAMREGAPSLEAGNEAARLKRLAANFVAEAQEQGFCADQMREALEAVLRPLETHRIVVVDSHPDLHAAFHFELNRLFDVAVEVRAISEIRREGPEAFDKALLLTSQYNAEPLQEAVGPECRIIVYRVEVEQLIAELRSYPPETTLGVVSASPSQLERAKAVLSGFWDGDRLLTACLDDVSSLRALIRHADALAMDFMSYERIKAETTKPIHVYRYLSEGALHSLSRYLPPGALRRV